MSQSSKVEQQKRKTFKERTRSSLGKWRGRDGNKENAPTVSVSSALKEVKSSAADKLDSVKSVVEQFSTRVLKLSRRSNGRRSPYKNLESPVKLYSPFSIVTPQATPERTLDSPCGRKHHANTPRRCIFATPTGKFANDLRDAQRGIDELEILARKLTATTPTSRLRASQRK